ncbi:sensor histidine kinase [Roseibium marinum]|uniref:Histidine kinase/DNA gyrase B/HSP90-like ATPase n=1 Tax=Roseibium marinum TaxID=281252 RepID=A0A2S3UZG6_9HYPH|nr:ATP-binding protein [Roseibium marinum]POF32859.1 histidine kinase/DNA gyrase B/HSP90-like ATPase [Roseibium marinum]
MTDHLKFSPDILRRLGEELVPDIDQGIVELVKNGYDADATTCKITLADPMSGNGSIAIIDDGIGMTGNQIRKGWLVIGRSDKAKGALTSKFKRVPVGDKGLGRLAALRLGNRVILTTRPASEPGKQYSTSLDWLEYEKADVVEDVALAIAETETDLPHGTEIRIEGIEARITRTTVNKLARSLLLLSDPFARFDDQLSNGRLKSTKRSRIIDPGFSANLLTMEFKDLQAKVGKSYFSDAEYRIQAELHANGNATFRIMDWKGEIVHEAMAGDTFHAPPFTFDLWVFVLSKDSFSTRSSTLSEVRDWLAELGGVHVYEDGIRVPPYGGEENDFLGLNLRRVRSPEVRPSTNTSVGRIKINNTDGSLIQKTDRIGYVENYAFGELKRACGEALDWAARILLKERERKREADKQSKKEKAAKATSDLERVLSKNFKPTERKKVDKAIQSYVKATEKEADSLREDLELYRSLATAGMISAVFAHEIGKPLGLIDNAIKGLIRLVPDEDQRKANARVGRIQTSRTRLSSFVSIPLRLLSKHKRRTGRIDVNRCIGSMVEMLEPISANYDTLITFKPSETGLFVNGTEALLDGIIINLILNSFNAFLRDNFEQDKRRIKIETWSDTTNILIRIEDNAGGIDGVSVEDIWLPGVTTVADGTGFGLTIVRDSIKDLNGTIRVDPITDFGGARFTISLRPMRELFGR